MPSNLFSSLKAVVIFIRTLSEWISAYCRDHMILNAYTQWNLWKENLNIYEQLSVKYLDKYSFKPSIFYNLLYCGRQNYQKFFPTKNILVLGQIYDTVDLQLYMLHVFIITVLGSPVCVQFT